MRRESVKSQIWQDPWSASLISLVGQHGDVVEGLELVNETLRFSQRDEVHWWDAELRRVKGELVLRIDDKGVVGIEVDTAQIPLL